MRITKEKEIKFSKKDLEWFDHWITEAENFMAKTKQDFIITDDFNEACKFLDSQ